mmetsp:Transcript_65553/g.185934  ORF Transcript_65553/g.185934 Transcript_65553/m.185934 type:complete len:265 (-) Transcript_65553:413-1207(-)
MKPVHFPNGQGAYVCCCQHVGATLIQAELAHDGCCEVEWEAGVCQRVGHPAKLRHVLGAYELEVLHHGVRHLVPQPGARRDPCHLGELPGVGAEDHGHGARHGVVPGKEPHLGPAQAPVPVRVVPRGELLRLRALQRGDREEPAHVAKVPGGDVARVGGVEEREGLVQHGLLALPLSGQLGHELVKDLLHPVHRDTEGLDAHLDSVTEPVAPLSNLEEEWPQSRKKPVKCLADVGQRRPQGVPRCVQNLRDELLDRVGGIGLLD